MDVDTVVDITCSFSYQWSYTFAGPTASTLNGSLVGWRLLVDGVEVASSPLHGAARMYDSVLLLGTYVAAAGKHKAHLEAWQRTTTGGQTGTDITIDYGQIIVEQIRR